MRGALELIVHRDLDLRGCATPTLLARGPSGDGRTAGRHTRLRARDVHGHEIRTVRVVDLTGSLLGYAPRTTRNSGPRSDPCRQ